MKIYFANPPLRNLHFSRSQRSPGVIKSGTMYYPYWLVHAAALCESKGHEVFVLDCPADGKDRDSLLQSIENFDADLIVLDTSTASINYDMETLSYLKSRYKASYVLVGTHVTSQWKECLEKCQSIDFLAIGEFDYTILELANSLENNGEIEAVDGIAFVKNGKPVLTNTRLPIEDMDSLPWISPLYKKFLNPSNYLFTIARQPMVMLIGGRGCKAKCFYCVYPQVMHGHHYRTRSVDHLVGEMKWVQENMPEIKEIVFEDDTFTADKKRAVEFAKKVRSQGIKLPWFANIRTNTSYEVLRELKDAGLRECAVGFESGDDDLLAKMRKGQNVQAQKKFMENCKSLDLLVHGCFMVGFPGETIDTMQKTLELALELNPDSAQFYPVMPYPGTGAYKWAKKNGFIKAHIFDEWINKEGGHDCVLELPGLSSKDISDFCDKAFRKFHFRPKYIFKKLTQAILNPYEGRRSINAGINYISSIFSKEEVEIGAVEGISSDNYEHKEKVPYGRMELQENLIKKSRLESWDDSTTKIKLIEIDLHDRS